MDNKFLLQKITNDFILIKFIVIRLKEHIKLLFFLFKEKESFMESNIKVKKKIIAILILMVTIFSCISPAFAATGTFVGRSI